MRASFETRVADLVATGKSTRHARDRAWRPAGPASNATFSPTDLAFFARPRTWPEITARFAAWRAAAILDAVLDAENEGGRDLLFWRPAPRSTWQLTAQGAALLAPSSRGGRR